MEQGPAITVNAGNRRTGPAGRSRSWAPALRGAAGVGGNFVVVRHSGGEHSHYTHLAAGSVRVKRGDKVASGQVLGKLGHTGNSTEPHLHFTVADGPDPLYARSLPVRYEGLTTADGPQEPVHPQSGWIVESAPPAAIPRSSSKTRTAPSR